MQLIYKNHTSACYIKYADMNYSIKGREGFLIPTANFIRIKGDIAMVTEQSRQQDMIYTVKQLHKRRKRRRLITRLCIWCLLAVVVCFFIVKVAAGLLSIFDRGKAALETVFSSGTSAHPNGMSKGYIVLDPGHGGEDSPGCIYGGLMERDVTLELSLLIRDDLVQQGYTVLTTRESDESVSLEQRAEIANESGADLFLSIHLNAYEDGSVSGIETWFNPDTNTRSSALAEYIQQSIVASVEGKDRRTYSDTSLIVTREVLIPSCLAEVGYLSNDEEREKMSTKTYREKLAQGIVDGITQYFEGFPLDD